MFEKLKKIRIAGYFTVEASLIVPYIFALILLSILLSFFLYNHCILFQSCYLAALRGQQLKDVSDTGVEEYVDNELSVLLNEQVYSYQVNGKASVDLISISVRADTGFKNSLQEFGLYKERVFNSSRNVKVNRINPTDVVRKIHVFIK